MSVKLSLLDKEFPFNGVTHTRIVVRAVVLNEKNEIGLCHVVRDDIFGKCDYVETPGGGKEENESNIEGVIRELDEELGYKCEVIDSLGVVEDYYNLIFRKNINYYYLCKIDQKTKVHHVSKGDEYIKGIYWLSMDEAIRKYENMSDTGLEKLVKQRELPILLAAKKVLEL